VPASLIWTNGTEPGEYLRKQTEQPFIAWHFINIHIITKNWGGAGPIVHANL
jgi:hypothetical protein